MMPTTLTAITTSTTVNTMYRPVRTRRVETRQLTASTAKDSGKAANPTRAIVIPPGDVNAMPAAAAARTGSIRYLRLIRTKTIDTITNGSRLSAALSSDADRDFSPE